MNEKRSTTLTDVCYGGGVDWSMHANTRCVVVVARRCGISRVGAQCREFQARLCVCRRWSVIIFRLLVCVGVFSLVLLFVPSCIFGSCSIFKSFHDKQKSTRPIRRRWPRSATKHVAGTRVSCGKIRQT